MSRIDLPILQHHPEVQKQRLGVGNPETGIGSAAPLLGVMAIAGGLLKKSNR